MVAEQDSMQHGHAPQDTRSDMSTAPGAYPGQAAPCHCCVCHTLPCMSMTYTSFHWHASHVPPNKYFSAPAYPLPPLGAHFLPPAPLDDKKQDSLGVQHTRCFIRHLLQCLHWSCHNIAGFCPWDPCSCWRYTLLQVTLFPVVEIDKLGTEIRWESDFQANTRKEGRGRLCTENMDGGHEVGASTGGNTDHVRLG